MADHAPLVTVRYGGSFVVVQLAIGVLALLWVWVGAPAVRVSVPVIPTAFIGIVFVIGGALMARGSTFVTVEDDAFIKHALVGPLTRRFPFDSWAEVSYDGGRVRIAGKRLPFSRTGARSADWAALEALLAEMLRS
jgi:hypothetical protein